ncbi:MAG: potassium-transporting ATPase subunit KdpA [Acidobacteriota bacterium]
MQMSVWLKLGVYVVLVLGCAPVLGFLLARVLDREHTWISRPLAALEKGIYRICGVDPSAEMSWKEYAGSLIGFHVLGFLFLLTLLLAQGWLPLNPQQLASVPLWLAVETAASFVTNTNWQAYSGESTLSYLTQMLGLTVQNFLSAAVGIAVLLALTRGLTRSATQNLGNFWVDLTRSVLYVLLPMSFVIALVLVSQGVIQNLSPYVTAKTLEGSAQLLPMGPAASQVAIKQLGTNGGGFFGANSTHPFENPTPLSNWVEMVAILLLPAGLVDAFGRLLRRRRHAWSLMAAMMMIFVLTAGFALYAEYQPNPVLHGAPFLEGKETRVGLADSVIWGLATTAASNGSVNAMHDSFSPLAGGFALLNILLGEVVFGGVGAGLYGMVLFVVITVFIAGLMVGRTPEYLGKKIESKEVRMAAVGILLPSALILVLSALACLVPAGLSRLGNGGPHGLTEILYAFASGAGNNGSAFGGLSANTTFYHVMMSIAMVGGRFGVLLPVLALAGSLVVKRSAPASAGTFPTDGPLFVLLLISVVLIVGALTFLPALCLGPIVEHGLMMRGRTF